MLLALSSRLARRLHDLAIICPNCVREGSINIYYFPLQSRTQFDRLFLIKHSRIRRAEQEAYYIYHPVHYHTCSYCHHLREYEPILKRECFYKNDRRTVDWICPYCVQTEAEARIFFRLYDFAYEIIRDGRYYHLRLVPQLSLFTTGGSPNEHQA